MTESKQAQLGWHWLWFVPLCLSVLLLAERHTVLFGLSLTNLAWHRWSWGALFSPSAAFCLSVILFSVFVPLRILLVVYLLVLAKQPWSWVIFLSLAVLVLPSLTDFLIWGSFPFTIDSEGVARLRMIPFLPWPDGSYLEF
jgi:hypothetical protein